MESVFRTTEGFPTWVGWLSGVEPTGNQAQPPGNDDCVLRDHGTHKWNDHNCDDAAIYFYCETKSD